MKNAERWGTFRMKNVYDHSHHMPKVMIDVKRAAQRKKSKFYCFSDSKNIGNIIMFSNLDGTPC